MSGTASPMWQTNGTVESVIIANGVIYAGGSFTKVRPPGTSASTSQAVARNNLAAFNASTGALITGFNPNVNGKVRALAMSPSGSTLYLGGSFTSVKGTTRNRIAAVNPTTGALVSTFNPNAGSTVNAIAASSSAVFVGGAFGRIGGVSTQKYLASVNPTSGAINAGFDPVMQQRPDLICTPGSFGCNDAGRVVYTPSVTALNTDAAGSYLLVGGNFIGTNGNSQGGMGSLDPSNGDNRTWLANTEPSNNQPINTSCQGRVTDMAVSTVNGVPTAFVTAEGDPPGCYEGSYAARLSDGHINWISSCLGASQAMAVLNGVLFHGSHNHDCAFDLGGHGSGYVGGTDRGSFVHRHLRGQDVTDGTFVHWSPDTNGAGNQPVGPRALDAANVNGTGVVVVGGDFTLVNGTAQQGLTRFVTGGDTATPAVPGRNINADKWPDTPIHVAMRLPITVQPTAANTLTVEIPTVDDADTGTLTYRIYRDGGSNPIASLTAESYPGNRPVLRYDDTNLSAGSHSYQVSASDGIHTSAKSTAVSGVASNSAPPAFATQMSSLNPIVWWRLGDSGSTATDSSSNGTRTGDLQPGATAGAPGAVNGNTAVTLDGTNGYVTSTNPIPDTTAFSEAAWFKTNTVTGGVIVAQSDQKTGGAAANNDRVIVMDNNGGLVFAMKAGQSFGPFGFPTINIRNQGPIWNDGKWHLAVGTYDGNGNAALYVDGWLQGTATGTPFDSTAKANGMTNAYLRAGYADVSQTPVRFGINFYNNPWPNTQHFQGSIDEVTAFNRALTAGEVASMFAAGVGGGA